MIRIATRDDAELVKQRLEELGLSPRLEKQQSRRERVDPVVGRRPAAGAVLRAIEALRDLAAKAVRE